MQLLIVSLGMVLASYLIGSISSAILVSRAFGLPDPRTVGSNNPGSTNVLRVGGKLPAFFTLLGDSLKGFIPVYAAKLYIYSLVLPKAIVLMGFKIVNYPHLIVSAVFLAAILGHLYPIFFKFKGGKGVATALGGLLGLKWVLGLGALGIWILTLCLSGYSALSALAASAFMPVMAYKMAPEYDLVILVVSVLIFWRHRVNIQNLLKGTESKVWTKKTPK